MTILLKEIHVGYATGDWYLRMYEDSCTQSIDGNSSVIKLRLTLRANTSTWVEFDSRDAWIGDTHFSIAYRHANAEHDLGTTNLTVKHLTDGTGFYNISFGISTSFALNGNSSGGRTLPTIPRASSFTISGNTLGSAISVGINSASSSFRHTVRYQFGSIIREYSGQATSCTFTPPLSDATQIPNSLTGNATITVDTYNSGTHIGTKSNSVTLNIVASACAPTFTELRITRIDNGVPPSWGVFVEGISKSMIEIIGASAQYGASIKSYAITAGTYSGGNKLTTDTFLAGEIIVKGFISDSRGVTKEHVTKIEVYPNGIPSLSIKAIRCNSEGIESNEGTYLKIVPTYSCFSINSLNSIVAKSFKVTGTTYENTTGSSDTSFILGNGDISIAKTYEVVGSVRDALGQSSKSIKVLVSSSSVPFNLRDDGTGAAFGTYAEKENALESNWKLFLKNGLTNVQNNVTTSIVSHDSAYTHFETDALEGHCFNKPVYVQEDNDNKQRLAYISELQGHASNHVLWSGAWLMDANQSAILSQSIREQPHGIVLVFSKYQGGDVYDYDWSTMFLPKYAISFSNGNGYDFNMNTMKNEMFMNKYLYIFDTKIVGHSVNATSGTGTASVVYYNNNCVLRYVIGV